MCRRAIATWRSRLRFASKAEVEPLVDAQRRFMGITIFHLRYEIEVIATALACAVVTEPAVLRKGHFEDVLTGSFVNRAGAFKAIAVASAAHFGREAVMFKHLLKRHGGLDGRKVDEWF